MSTPAEDLSKPPDPTGVALERAPLAAVGDRPAGEESDDCLMERAKGGDRAAYAKIFERYADRIRRTVYLVLHCPSAADDAVQETFTRGLTHIGSYRGEAEPQAWFFAIAMNICRHVLRSEKRGAELAEADRLESGMRFARPRTKGVVSRAIQKENHRLLKVALGYLTQAQREAFVLHYVENMPYEEIGRILGIRAGAARALAHRARKVLREQLGSELPPAR